jgi:disulfide bond formation protein DsbB
MLINRVLDPAVLVQTYQILAMICMVLSVYVTQKTWHDEIAEYDPAPLRWLRRGALLGVAGAIGWSVVYMEQSNSTPWPPMVLLVAVIDVLFSVRAVILYWRSLPNHSLNERLKGGGGFTEHRHSGRNHYVR